jgi:streptogramin lyase
MELCRYPKCPSYLIADPKWGSQGNGSGQFNDPFGIAVDSVNNIYVADTFNHRIQKFDSSGNFIATWGSLGSANSQFNTPASVTVDNADNIYVADTYNHRIQKFDSSGNFLTTWGG